MDVGQMSSTSTGVPSSGSESDPGTSISQRMVQAISAAPVPYYPVVMEDEYWCEDWPEAGEWDCWADDAD